MSFEDARKIWSGGDTAATEYFRAKTSDALANAFRPVVEKATNEVGVTRQFKDLVGRFQAIPFARVESLDVDQYVVGKALDGLQPDGADHRPAERGIWEIAGRRRIAPRRACRMCGRSAVPDLRLTGCFDLG